MLTRRSFLSRVAGVVAGLAITLRVKKYTPTWTLDDLQYGADWIYQHFGDAIDEVLMSYEDRRHLIDLYSLDDAPDDLMFNQLTLFFRDVQVIARRDVVPGELWLGFTRSTPWPFAVVDGRHDVDWRDPALKRPARRPPFSCRYVPATRTIASLKPRSAFHES